MRKMRKTVLGVVLLFLSACIACSSAAQQRPLPPSPLKRGATEPDAAQREKARRICDLACRENRRLSPDDCLARQAFRRAKHITDQMDKHPGDDRYFAHEDPVSGENPAWNYVYSCFEARIRTAGENLAMGDNTAEAVHRSLMNSSSHRSNILNPKYSRVGGCLL